MKIIKKIFLIVLALFTFVACTSTVGFETNVAPVKASQQTVIVANYPDNWADARDILNTNLRYGGWTAGGILEREIQIVCPARHSGRRGMHAPRVTRRRTWKPMARSPARRGATMVRLTS